GKQLVPAVWVEAATARQTSNGSNPNSDWDQGYGYQFWRCRHGAYRGDGAFGQYCLVMPEQDAVIAITSGTRDMQGVLNLIWDKLLPAMQSASLPANESARKELERAMSKLVLPMPQGAAASSLSAKISGKRFLFPTNSQKLEAITFESAAGHPTTLVMRVNGA